MTAFTAFSLMWRRVGGTLFQVWGEQNSGEDDDDDDDDEYGDGDEFVVDYGGLWWIAVDSGGLWRIVESELESGSEGEYGKDRRQGVG